MLETNKVTDEIRKSLDRKDYEFGIQSLDVSADGKKALVLGIFEDPDFPEIFVYSAKSGKARRVNNEGAFIDVPMGKAFWAENGRDFYVNRYDCDTLYRVEFDTKTYKIKRFEEVEQSDGYIETKLRQVLDFFRDDNNYKEPVVTPDFEGPYHQFALGLLAALEAGVQSAVSRCKLSRLDPDPEALKRAAMNALSHRQSIYFSIEQLKQELGIRIDTSDLKAGLETLREMSGLPADDVPL